jgi:hypothetical protein
MATISILANTIRPSVNRSLDNTASGVVTFSWQDPVHSWKAGPGEVMTVEKFTKIYHLTNLFLLQGISIYNTEFSEMVGSYFM